MDKEFDLVHKILKGDINRFETLINDYQRLVAHIVFRMTGTSEGLEELCHEIFIKVYQNLERFNFNAKLSTWIARIAHNHCINHLRKRKVELIDDRAAHDDDNANLLDKISTGAYSESSIPDQELEQKELTGYIQKEIQQLPENYRTILTLYHVDEMSYKDISEILDLPEGTVKSYLFRARKQLKEKLVMRTRGEEVWQ